jgi:hypothetical protein
MNTQKLYYHLVTASDSPCHLTREGYAEAERTWLCPECYTPRPGLTAIDACIQLAPTKEPLNFIYGAGVPIASKEFFSKLDANMVERDLYLGRLYDSNGIELKHWATFRGKCRLIVRGSKNAQYRICETCGRTVYFAMGKSYLHPDPSPDVGLFESDLRGLILAETIFQQCGLQNTPGIYVQKLPALAMPKDSFGELAPYSS